MSDVHDVPPLTRRIEALRAALEEIVNAKAHESHDATAYSLYLIAWHALKADESQASSDYSTPEREVEDA